VQTAVLVLLVVVAAALILAVLLQTGHVAGLSGSITGTSQQMMGKKKGLDEVLERATLVLGALLVILTVLAVHFWG
jgi:preprotein translocase subunit SecG